MLMRFIKTISATCLLALFTTTANAVPLLQVEFGSELPNGPLQPGFEGMWGTNDQPTVATFGPYSVELRADSSMTGTQSSRGFFDKLAGNGGRIDNLDPSIQPFYSDFFFNRSTINGEGIDLKITGLTPNHPYTLSVVSYDADASLTVPTTQQWGPKVGSNTTGTAATIDMLRQTPDPEFAWPSELWESEWTGTMQVMTSTGTLDIFGTTSEGSRGTVLNGFKLNDGTNDVLVIDLGEGASASVTPGFHHMSGPHFDASPSDGGTATYGAYTVSVERIGGSFGDAGFYNEHAIRMGGEVLPPETHNMFRDCFCNVNTAEGNGILLTIDGVTPNTEYDLTIWDMDPALPAGEATESPTRWEPAPGSETTGTTGIVVNKRTPVPQTLDDPEHSTTIRVQSTGTTLQIFGTTTGGVGGVRLNGFSLSAVEDGLTGDFNDDGSVDAADYVVWRKSINTTEAYDNEWLPNFGTSANGSGGSGTVPEPGAACFVLLIGAIQASARHRRR